MIRAGALRLVATLQARVTTDTSVYGQDDGAQSVSYETVGTVYLDDVSSVGKAGRELQQQRQTRPQLSHAFKARYRPDITAAHRLVLGDRVFHVVSVDDPEQRRRELLLLCMEVVHV